MARKFPTLPVPEEEDECQRVVDASGARPHSGQTPTSSTSSSRHSSASSGSSTVSRPVQTGTVPRPPSFRRSPALEMSRRAALQSRRRRLDSLNIDEDPALARDRAPGDGFLGHLTDWLPHLPPSGYPEQPLPVRPVEDIEDEGGELYLHFFHEQMRQAGIEARSLEESEGLDTYHDLATHLDGPDGAFGSPSLTRRRKASFNLGNFCNPAWRQAGRDLQSLADEFSHSRERDLVRRRAEQVNIFALDKHKFIALLNELFEDGRITRERILVLFFFCSDVSILAVRNHLSGILAQLTKWTLAFIKERICSWVHARGGWEVVLRSGLSILQQLAVISTCAAVISLCVLVSRKCL